MFVRRIFIELKRINRFEGRFWVQYWGSEMRVSKLNILGWFIIIFMGISDYYLKEELSLINTGLGGLICITIGAWFIFHKAPKKKNDQ